MKIGVLLSGSGLYDGTDVQEAVLSLVALERAGARPVCLAPSRRQLHTVSHLTGDESPGEERQVLEEAARLARGKIQDLGEFWPGALQGLVIPGGYGVPKTLITGFMELGATREPIPEVRALLDDLTGRKRPLGAIGLGRTLIKAYFGGELEESEVVLPADRVEVDAGRRTVFTPGFLAADRAADVAAGIDAMVAELMRMAAAAPAAAG